MTTEDHAEAGVTVASCDLHRVLRDALPFAGRDDPATEIICLEAVRGVLSATATDRYTLGHARAKSRGAFGQQVVLSCDWARIVKRALPSGSAPHAAYGQTTLLVEDNSLRVRVAIDRDGHSTDLVVPLSRVAFPEYATLATKLVDHPSGLPLGLSPHLVARFAKVASRREQPLHVFIHNAMSRVLVEVGDGFIGAIMTIRLGDHVDWPTEPTVPLGHPEPAAVPA